jgi:putative hydrolase of the HAD superfamily
MIKVRRARIGGEFAKSSDHLWLFDLDNTLHDTSHQLFGHISRGMTEAVMECLDVDEEQAHEIRQRYWRRYGATMIGLFKHHGIDPQVFLHRSHQFDVRPLIRAESGLRDKLGRLPGRKVLVTNAPLHYARAVLKHLGLLRHFHSLWSIEHLKIHGHFRPKPSVSLMRHIIACEGASAARTVLVEDTLENLRGARKAA